MILHKFGNENNPVMVLIHGMLTPWQVWNDHINYFEERFYVIAVAINSHTAEETTEFVSLSAETKELDKLLSDDGITKIDVLCGLSLGGVIAYSFWKNTDIEVTNLVLDGAPLAPFPKIAENVMKRSYTDIIRKSKARDSKTLADFKKQFLPEKFLEDYLEIADRMSSESVKNLISAVSGDQLDSIKKTDTRIFYLHGTKGNEIISKRTGHLLKKMYPENVTVKCFPGDTHCYKVIYKPDEWLRNVDDFLDMQR